ncbi:MAG: SAV_2336 N-terminal domain-related protein, partial [Xenococcus sp. (in: cyanobacteria)]
MSDRFEKFLKTLNQSELEMTSFEIADMCWLLLHASQISDRRESKIEQRVTSRDITIVEDNNEEFSGDRDQDRNRNNLSSSLSSKQKKPAGKLFPQEQPKAKLIRQEDKSLTFKVDNPTDLGSSLFLARALKPLLRRVPTIGRSEVLDEIATVDNYAATDKKILAPIFKPALEPWLELALVIDDNVSMDIWHQTIADLITFLGNYGIFRNVQVWKLASQQENLSLYKGLNIAKSRVASPKEILNPDGRRVIILVSDCVANYWHDGRIFPFLEQWSKNTFAILQMLPEWLWLRTSLSSGAKVTFVSNEPGVTNSRLRVKDISLWEDVFYDKNRLQIPLFTLEPKSLEQWSSVVAGRSNMKVSGFVLTPPKIEKKREFASRASKEFDFEAEQNLTSAERVRRFRNNSTLLAQELAELLAAAPTIFLPVVRLIRREMLPPDAGQVQIAEVFLGGIMKVRSNYSQETDPDLVLYDFVEPEVREILQRSSNRHTTLEVFDRVS